MAEALSENRSDIQFWQDHYGDQALYHARSKQVVNEGVALIQTELAKRRSSETIYSDFRQLLAHRRDSLAYEQNSEDVEAFGLFRIAEEPQDFVNPYTHLSGHYKH